MNRPWIRESWTVHFMPRRDRASELVAYLDRDSWVRRRQPLVASFGRAGFEGALARGHIVELLPGIFAHAARAGTFTTRVNAVAMWQQRHAVVSGLAALALYGLTDTAPRRVTVVASRNHRVRGPGWVRVVRTSSRLRVSMRGRVRCASRERALIDAWSEAPASERTSVILEAMRRSNLRGLSVLAELSRCTHVTDRRGLVRILNEASEGIQSYLEHRAKRTVLNTADFRGLRRQVEVFAMGERYVVDTLHEPTGTVIEFDGARVHGGVAAKRRDNTRDAALSTLGFLTVRIGYDDVVTRPLWCREVVRRVIAQRAGGHGVSQKAP